MSRAATELTALAEGTAGEVQIGAFISAAPSVIPAALARLRSSHPGVRITLRELEQSQTYALLFRGELDLAITFDYEHAPESGPNGIRQEHLMDDPIMVVLPVGHPLAGAGRIDPAEVPSGAWINTTVDVAGLTAARQEDGSGRAHHLDFEGQDFRTALNLVAAGLGAALLPRLLLLDSPPSVVVLPMSQPKLVPRLYTCRLDTRAVTASIRRLETYLREATAGL